MIVLFTDFGIHGPYTGQMKAVLHGKAPGIPIVDLLGDAPVFDPRASSYLLAAYSMIDAFPLGTVFLCVVDPGVGGARDGLMINADGRWYVGPDNGLFEIVLRRSEAVTIWRIGLPTNEVSASFHGRDIFAPAAAGLAVGQGAKDAGDGSLLRSDSIVRYPWPDDLAEIIYLDSYGNAVSGIHSSGVDKNHRLHTENMENRTISRAHTFSDVSPNAVFWYENSSGLVEIAVNGGRADEVLGLRIGSRVWLSAN